MVYMSVFFFNDTATTEIYTPSLHDALPIFSIATLRPRGAVEKRIGDALERGDDNDHRIVIRRIQDDTAGVPDAVWCRDRDRKSTRLNSSHLVISYAVFCLQKNTSRDLDSRT